MNRRPVGLCDLREPFQRSRAVVTSALKSCPGAAVPAFTLNLFVLALVAAWKTLNSALINLGPTAAPSGLATEDGPGVAFLIASPVLSRRQAPVSASQSTSHRDDQRCVGLRTGGRVRRRLHSWLNAPGLSARTG